MPLHKRSLILTTIIATAIFGRAASTQDKCYDDCRSNRRPVGPTRPWDAIDDLRNMLRLTHPYPHYVADQDDELAAYDFAKFCDLGCNYFFVSSGAEKNTPNNQHNKVSTLGQCLDQCDENFSYNITVGYSDLLEIGRLECRDGCQMGLQRCQPGYYCLQVSFDIETDSSSSVLDAQFSGGEMIPCPAGTYRETSYDAITECIPCSANYFREDIKGKRPSDCSECPPNTSSKSGSTSVKDCIRCPAGTFSVEAGYCECITPMACKNQLPSPADAEKKDTVPYIGRW